MDARESNVNEDIIGHVLLFLPVRHLYLFSLVDKSWFHKALDREGIIATVPDSAAQRLSRLRPRGIALRLPDDSDERSGEIIVALCGMVQNATSVEITSQDDEVNDDDYIKLCAAMHNVTKLVLRSSILAVITPFSYFPHLRCLQIWVPEDEIDDIFDNLIQNCPKLEILHLIMDSSIFEKLQDLVTLLQPMKNLKEVIIDDPPRDSKHAIQLLTGESEPRSETIVRSLEALSSACPASLHPSHIYISSIEDLANYDAAESLSVLILPFIPESFLPTFVTKFLDANAKGIHKSISPAITALSASKACSLTPLRTSTNCIGILLAAGLDLFDRDRTDAATSVLHDYVQLHASEELAHVVDYVLAHHPQRLVELLYDAFGLTPLHYLTVSPSGTFEGANAVVNSLRGLGDLTTLLNDSNNVERETAVGRFVRQSCELLSHVKRAKSFFKEVMKLLKIFCAAEANKTAADGAGHSVLTHLLLSPGSSMDLILDVFMEEDIKNSLSAAPTVWANKFLQVSAVPTAAGPFLTIWKIAVERAGHAGRQAAFVKAMKCPLKSNEFVWELLVSHIISSGYDPLSPIDETKPWIALCKSAFLERVFLFEEKLGWDLAWHDGRGVSLLAYSTNHQPRTFDENYAKSVANLFLRMRNKPQDELSFYARAIGLSAFVGNMAYWMLSESTDTVKLFIAVTQIMAQSIVNDFLAFGDPILSSPRVCWLTVEALLYVGVANNIGQEKASKLLQQLAAHVDKEHCLGNSSVLISAATHACFAKKPEEFEWYCTAFTILFSDVWKDFCWESRSSHQHTIDLRFLEILQILMGDRWTDRRTSMVKIVVDAMDAAIVDLSPQEGISLLLFSKLFGLCNSAVAQHFSSTKMFQKYPILVVRLLCNLVRTPVDFPIAAAILEQHPNALNASELAGDWILRNFCYSLDVIHSTDTEQGPAECVAMLRRLVELGAKSSTPFSEDYKRQYKEKAVEDIVSLFEKTKV